MSPESPGRCTSHSTCLQCVQCVPGSVWPAGVHGLCVRLLCDWTWKCSELNGWKRTDGKTYWGFQSKRRQTNGSAWKSWTHWGRRTSGETWPCVSASVFKTLFQRGSLCWNCTRPWSLFLHQLHASHATNRLFFDVILLEDLVWYSPLCWKSGCLRVPWMQCRGEDAMEGQATGEGGACFILIGLEACLWSGEGPEDFRRAWLFSGHASRCVAAVSAPAAMETADPHLWAQNRTEFNQSRRLVTERLLRAVEVDGETAPRLHVPVHWSLRAH